MAKNYLHNFTKVMDQAVKKFDGISKALEIEDSKDFQLTERYKEKVLHFRKQIRTVRLLTISDIFGVIEDFVTDDTFEIFGIEKALQFIDGFEGSQKTIKSIMNKMDKAIRSSINKEILSQYNITANVRRSSHWGFEDVNQLKTLVDKRKSEHIPHQRYGIEETETETYSTASPVWNIDITIPIPHIRYTGSGIDCLVPYEINTVNVTDSQHPFMILKVRYNFDSFTEFFIENIGKLDQFKKDTDFFIKTLMDSCDRQMSFNNNVTKDIHGRASSGSRYPIHPYKGSSNQSWCTGDLNSQLEFAFKKMDLTLLATTAFNWLTNYNETTNPHHRIWKFYDWLPTTAGTNVSKMRHNDNQQSRCWDTHTSVKICEGRKCAFLKTCAPYLENLVDQRDNFSVSPAEPPIPPTISGEEPLPALESLENVRERYASELFTLMSMDSASKENIIFELRSRSDDMFEAGASSGYLQDWKNVINSAFLDELSLDALYMITSHARNLFPDPDEEIGVGMRQPVIEEGDL